MLAKKYRVSFFLMQTAMTIITNLHIQDCFACLTKFRYIIYNPTKFNIISNITSHKNEKRDQAMKKYKTIIQKFNNEKKQPRDIKRYLIRQPLILEDLEGIFSIKNLSENFELHNFFLYSRFTIGIIWYSSSYF